MEGLNPAKWSSELTEIWNAHKKLILAEFAYCHIILSVVPFAAAFNLNVRQLFLCIAYEICNIAHIKLKNL